MDWGELQDTADKGPWFSAGFTGGEASCCGEEIVIGEKIRADGSGAYEHKACDGTTDRASGQRDRFIGTSLNEMGY
jgi:hypothetical protein